MNTIYTAYSVLKNYIEKVQSLSVQHISLMEQATDRVVIWVEENDKNISHFVCIKMSCTQFLIWGYNGNYEQIINTGYDYADVNTPKIQQEKAY